MKYTVEGPKLPKLPFIAGDLLLIATAVFIAMRSASPIQPLPLLIIGLCVIVGAALLVVPFMADYARRQDAELTERQNQIAALARTTSESADQLSIAASGLNTIAESSKQTFHAAEKLPGQLKARLDELTEQLAGTSLASQSALKEQLADLERAVEKVARALEKSEAAAKAKNEALAAAETRLVEALTRAAAQIDSLVADAVTRAVRTAQPGAAEPVQTATTAGEALPEAPVHEATAAPKPRQSAKHRARHETAPTAAPADAVVEPAQPAPATEEVIAEKSAEPAADSKPVEAVDVAPSSPAKPSANVAPEPSVGAPATQEQAAADESAPVAKAPRVRKPKHADDGFDLGLTPADPVEAAESAVTSDGFTRLIATAYIGIGNKLFIRGEGPGLSWEKGVPLQFVSIGKWRWESADVIAPVKAKLFKNDQVECVGLGALTLQPGHHHEVNAGF